jgi:hypothetical protein
MEDTKLRNGFSSSSSSSSSSTSSSSDTKHGGSNNLPNPDVLIAKTDGSRHMVCVPSWVKHQMKKDGIDKIQTFPIYSCDLECKGLRFATGGSGMFCCSLIRLICSSFVIISSSSLDGRLKIWSSAPLFSSEAELDEKTPRLLCTLTQHSSAVECVKWSPYVLLFRFVLLLPS